MTPAEFRAARVLLGLTQEELARAWAVSTQTVGNKESGRTPISRVEEAWLMREVEAWCGGASPSGPQSP